MNKGEKNEILFKIYLCYLKKNRNDNFAFSKLVNTLSKSDSVFKGSINKKNNILNSDKILIENNDDKIIIAGQYNLINEKIEFDLDLEQNNIIYLSAKISGNINSPNIIFDKDSKFFKELNHNENNIIEKSIIQFLENYFINK